MHFAIPLTPHTVSFQVTNTLVSNLQGESRGTSNVRYGFEFTIPLTLRRYFGTRAGPTDSQSDSTGLAASAAVDSQVYARAATPAPPAPGRSTAPIVPSPLADTAARLPPDTSRKTTRTPSNSAAPKSAPSSRASNVLRTGMRNVNYLQSRLQVTVGTTVEWKNNDPLAHSVTAADKSFNSGLIQPGKTFRHTFAKAGTFNFYCMPHPFMKGVIIVKEP